MLTKEMVAKALPASLKSSVTQQLVDTVNNVVSDPLIAEQVRENFLSYSHVLQDGKYKMEDYLNAVQYVSYKLMNKSNQDAYFLTFPHRHAALVAKGASKKDISAYVAAYNKNQLVNKILEQSLIPSWVLNQDKHQEAINVLADLMINAQSEKVRSDSANSLLTHLSKPKESGFQLNINAQESSGMNELRDLLKNIAQQSIQNIEQGQPIKEIAGQRIFTQEAGQ
ncbi:hypothetical protein D3C76_27980 [compost metagenome]